ncbi:uncharacterized protein LAESUDRAFT_700165, partial [Laetiporus sulphureus 93-53]
MNPSALILYDYFLTIGDEYEYIWKARFTFASALFYALRYCAILQTFIWIPWLAAFSSWPVSTSILFTALRMYAIYNKSKSVFALVLGLNIIAPAILVYTFTVMEPHLKTSHGGRAVCSYKTRISASAFDKWELGGRASSILADIVGMFLTWKKMHPINDVSKRAALGDSLLINTTWYFAALSVVNAVGIGISHLDSTLFTEPVHAWVAAQTSIILSRLMFRLRKLNASINDVTYFADDDADSLWVAAE